MLSEKKTNFNTNMGTEWKGTDAQQGNAVTRRRMPDSWWDRTDVRKGPHPTSTQPPSLLYTQDGQSCIVGTGAVRMWDGAPCGRPSPSLMRGNSHCGRPSPSLMRGNSHCGRLPIAYLCICILALFTLFIPLTAHAATANNGHISGQLLDGSRHDVPLAGQSVTLQMAQNSTAQDLLSVKTDEHGNFSFANLRTSKDTSYSVYILYQGAQYNTKLLDLSTKPVQQVNLMVYDATTSTSKVAVLAATILLHTPDAQKDIVTVSELYVFNNFDNHTYVGSLNTSNGMPNALRFSLPHTASNVSLSTGFNGYQTVQVDRGFASNAAVLPGISQFAFTFDMPYSESGYDFDYLVAYPTVQLSLYVPPDIHASSDTLASQGIVTANQQPYQLLHATTLQPGKEVHTQLEGLPLVLPNVGPSSTSGANTLWLIAALIAMAIVVLLTWSIYRSRRHRAVPVPAAKSNGKVQVQPARVAKSVKSTKTLPMLAEKVEKIGETGKTERVEKGASEQQQALLLELLDLDTAYEAGKLSKLVYQERRAKTKAKLRSLLAGEHANGSETTKRTTSSGKRTS